MQTQIDYIVNNPLERKPEKVIVKQRGTENVINRAEVKGRDAETVKIWTLIGLSKEQINSIVGFLS